MQFGVNPPDGALIMSWARLAATHLALNRALSPCSEAVATSAHCLNRGGTKFAT